MEIGINGKVVIVTGVRRGIGAAIAKAGQYIPVTGGSFMI